MNEFLLSDHFTDEEIVDLRSIIRMRRNVVMNNIMLMVTATTLLEEEELADLCVEYANLFHMDEECSICWNTKHVETMIRVIQRLEEIAPDMQLQTYDIAFSEMLL